MEYIFNPQARQCALGNYLYRKAKQSVMSYWAPKKRQYGRLYYARKARARPGAARRRMYQRSNTEIKFHDVTADVSPVTTTATEMVDLLTIPEDDTENGRTGRLVTLKSMTCRFTLILPSTTTLINTGDSIRIWCVLDKQCNGEDMDPAQLFTGTADFQAFNELANSHRYRILWKRQFSMQSTAGNQTAGFGEAELTFEVYKKLNLQIHYNASSGAIATVRSNNIAYVAQTRSGLIQLLSLTRFRYSDK